MFILFTACWPACYPAYLHASIRRQEWSHVFKWYCSHYTCMLASLQLHSDQPTRHHTSSIHHYPPQCCTTRKSLKSRDHITPALWQLHWLPIKARISFKIWVLMFNIHSGSSPHYMSSLVTPCTTVESRSSLCSSAKGDYVTQRTSSSFGRRAFAVAGPSEWNNLPVSIRHVPSIGSFKTKLKTHLFQIFYG